MRIDDSFFKVRSTDMDDAIDINDAASEASEDIASDINNDDVFAELGSDDIFPQSLDGTDTEEDADISNLVEKMPEIEVSDTSESVSDWIGEINPNYDEFDIDSPYSNNCGSCAYAVYQRLEGCDDACATADNIDFSSDMSNLTGMEQVSMSPEEIEARLLEEGDGAHAIIGIDRAEGPGHWFNAACIDGKVVAIDGQTGEITDWPPDYGDVVNWDMSIRRE